MFGLSDSRLALAAALVLGCSSLSGVAASAPARCSKSAESSRALVLAFYNEALVNRRPQQAFERFVAIDFVEHKPDVADGTRDGAVAFLAQLMDDLPQARWDVVRTIVEGQMVFLHARFTPAPGAGHYAIADVFRLQDCKIIEHWDVVGPPSRDARNPHSRF